MASWLSGPAAANPVKGSTSPPPPLPAPPTSLTVITRRPSVPSSSGSLAPPPLSQQQVTSGGAPLSVTLTKPAASSSKKKERWLVTRKTWRYMADAGKLLIPEVLRKGKDLKDYSAEDMVQLDETFQRACDQQQEFVIWEGPLVDPRILLARNRIATGAELIATTFMRGRYAEEDELEEEDEEQEEEELEEELEEDANVSGGGGNGGGQTRGRKGLHPGGVEDGRRSTSRSSVDRAARLKGGELDESGKNARNRRISAGIGAATVGGGGTSGIGMPTLKSVKGTRRAAGGSSSRRSTARMSSFGGFGPSGSTYRSGMYGGGGGFDSKLKRRESSRHGFFPSPYGTGMLPTGQLPDFDSQQHASRLRLMLPVGEKPPEGFTRVGNRNLPMGELPHYSPPSADSYLQLPSGLLLQELPAAYATDEDRDWYSRRSSSAPDSGVLSPTSQDELEHSGFYDNFVRDCRRESREDEERKHESGIASGADSIGAASNKDKKVNVYVQTEPFPEEFFMLQLEEKRKREEEERLAREAEERAQRESEAMEATIMGDSVMRYLKMVRRNSKSADHKKADRFRSMNYDPTLRNIKSKYLVSEDQIKGMKSVEVQVGDPIVSLLKKCQTPIDPSPDPAGMRKLSQAASDFSDSIVGSPPRRLSIPLPEEPLVPATDAEKDFFSQLYSGSMMPSMDSVPEDYYHYLESWYRAQKSLQPSSVGGRGVAADTAGANFPAGLHSGANTASTMTSSNAQRQQQSLQHQLHQLNPQHPLLQAQQLQQQQLQQLHAQHVQQVLQQQQKQHQHLFQQQQQQQQHQGQHQQQHQQNLQQQLQQHPQLQEQHTGIYIPVSALQNLRASLPTLTSAASSNSNVSKSNSSLGKNQSFLSSVISSKPFAGLGNLSAASGAATSRILPKKLWRARSKSQSRPSVSGGSAWTPQANCRWMHLSNRVVALEQTHLLLLHEFERVTLQKVALQKLNKSDLGTTIRIPKDSSDKSDKSKRRGYLLKKKVLRKDKEKDSQPSQQQQPQRNSGSQPVFGIPLSQCVDSPFRKRSTASDIPSPEDLQQQQQAPLAAAGQQQHHGTRSDSRTSVVSMAERGSHQERISSPLHSAGSCESLNNLDLLRRSSVGHSQCSALDALSVGSVLERLEDDPGIIGGGTVSPTFPNVPPIVMMCIRHLEQYGLRTVGIFRVSSSKKRVRQLREDFDNGGEITFNEDIAIHDVATLLKEFFRDLPEPLIPKELLHGLLAVHKFSSAQDQIIGLQRLMQLLPTVNRDTLFVLLHFLGLVAENADDRKLPDGTVEPGNKMDATNLATLFAPNLLHTFSDEPVNAATSSSKGSGFAPAAIITSMPAKQTPERMEHVSALRLLIDKRNAIFELPATELHDLYLHLWENFPEILDVLLRRRCAMMGQELIEDEEEFEFPVENRHEVRGRQRSRREGSEGSDGGGSTSSWFRFRDRSEQPPPDAQATAAAVAAAGDNSRWGFKRNSNRDKSGTRAGGVSAPGSSNADARPPSADDSKGGLRFSVPRRSSAISPEKEQFMSPKDPPRRNAESGGRGGGGGGGIDSSAVYSPAASSARGTTPSSDLFFGSGYTSPSIVTSPPPNASTLSSPTFSPPYSPPPLQQQKQHKHSRRRSSSSRPSISVELDSGDALVLQPVPQKKAAAAAAAAAAALEAMEDKPAAATGSTVQQQQQSRESDKPAVASKASMQSYRSKTDDIGKLIAELDNASATPPAAREVKKYVRRRYTDSRHPTTELPDVRLEVPENMSVQYPPIRKQQKIKAEEAAANAASSK